MADSYYWIYAKDLREIPEWIVEGHSWHNAVPLEKLQKLQMKVRMCCSKCEEKVKEEIREVKGVFDVRAEKAKRKVVVVVTPNRGDVERKVLRKARKVDKKAKFVELDAQEKVQKKPEKKEKKEASKKKDQEDRPLPGHGNGPRIPGREPEAAPSGYYPGTGTRNVVRQPPQSLSTDSDSPEYIKPKHRRRRRTGVRSVPKHKEGSIFKKVITCLGW